LLPEGVLVDLPVPSAIERESVGHERLGLLPDLVGLFGDELVFGSVVRSRSVRFVRLDPVRERDFAGTGGGDDAVSTVPYGIAEFRAEAFVPSPPERRLVRKRLESQILTERGMRSQVVVERGLVSAVDLLEDERPHQ
jgi:hypothetical protein